MMDAKATIQATLDLIEQRRAALLEHHPCAGLSYAARHAFERRAHNQDYLIEGRPETAELDAAGLLDPDKGNKTRDLTDLAIEHFAAWQHAYGAFKTVRNDVIAETRRKVGEAMWAAVNPDE